MVPATGSIWRGNAGGGGLEAISSVSGSFWLQMGINLPFKQSKSGNSLMDLEVMAELIYDLRINGQSVTDAVGAHPFSSCAL